MYAGQGVSLIGACAPAANIVRTLSAGVREVLGAVCRTVAASAQQTEVPND